MTKSVSGSSLVEVTVAVILFVSVFFLSLTAYMRFTTSGKTDKVFRSRLLVHDMALRAKQERQLVDQELVTDAFKVAVQFSAYKKIPNLILMELAAVDNAGDTLYHYQELMYEGQ